MSRDREKASPGASGGVWLWLAYAALTLRAGFARAAGLDPTALGQDDLWVGFLARHTEAGDLFTYHAPVPMGFLALLKATRWLVPDPELSLQIVPFICGLAVIPLSGWVTTRLTKRWELGLLAAVLVSLHPLAGLHSVRVKQFTWDAVVMLGLLGFGLGRLEPGRPERPWLFAASAMVALAASFNSIFAGAVLLHVRVLQAAAERSERPGVLGRAVASALAYDLFAVLLYYIRIRHQSAEWIVLYWQRHLAFPPATGLDPGWLLGALRRGYGVWMPRGLRPLALLAPIGFVTLLVRQPHRWQALAIAGLAVALPTAALLFVYPFGGFRTDFYFQPLLAVLGAIGAGGLGALVANALERVRPGGAKKRLLRSGIPLALTALLLAVPLPAGRYGTGKASSRNKDLVAVFDELAGSADLILLSPFSRWNIGYYTSRPIETRFQDPRERLLDFHFVEPPSRSFTGLNAVLDDPDLPDRVLLVALIARPQIPDYVNAFRKRGFRLAGGRENDIGSSAVQLWVRRGRTRQLSPGVVSERGPGRRSRQRAPRPSSSPGP